MKRKPCVGYDMYKYPKNRLQREHNEARLKHEDLLKKEHGEYEERKKVMDYIITSLSSNLKCSVFKNTDMALSRFEIYIEGDEQFYHVPINDASILFFTTLGVDIKTTDKHVPEIKKIVT